VTKVLGFSIHILTPFFIRYGCLFTDFSRREDDDFKENKDNVSLRAALSYFLKMANKNPSFFLSICMIIIYSREQSYSPGKIIYIEYFLIAPTNFFRHHCYFTVFLFSSPAKVLVKNLTHGWYYPSKYMYISISNLLTVLELDWQTAHLLKSIGYLTKASFVWSFSKPKGKDQDHWLTLVSKFGLF
jgi:hypothetical protein